MQVDEVRRALVRADVQALATRTQLPFELCMNLTVQCDYRVAAAEALIDSAIQQVAADLQAELDLQLFSGGAPGGGKAFAQGQHAERFIYHQRVRGILQAPRNLGVVTTCVS